MAGVTATAERTANLPFAQVVPDVPAPDGPPPDRADVVVVGAGPAGAAAAFFLARLGHDVVVYEKERFPRDKVCGDGLTPRAVRALQLLDLNAEAEGKAPGWARQEGLRMYGGGVVWDMPWPRDRRLPGALGDGDPGAARRDAGAPTPPCAGARVHQGHEVIAPLFLGANDDTVAGVRWASGDEQGTTRAPIVIVADGGSSRIAVQLGLHRDERRPMGVAVRGYWRSPRAAMEHMEGFLDLREGANEILPGYGWIFPLDDGLVNVGWGLISTSSTSDHQLPQGPLDWVAGLPEQWELNPDPGRQAAQRRPADGAQPPPSRVPRAARSWSVTPAAWSTRSTARASATPSRPPRSPRTPCTTRSPAAAPDALARLPGAPGRRLGRVLHPGPHLPRGDGAPHGHAALHRPTACRAAGSCTSPSRPWRTCSTPAHARTRRTP